MGFSAERPREVERVAVVLDQVRLQALRPVGGRARAHDPRGQGGDGRSHARAGRAPRPTGYREGTAPVRTGSLTSPTRYSTELQRVEPERDRAALVQHQRRSPAARPRRSPPAAGTLRLLSGAARSAPSAAGAGRRRSQNRQPSRAAASSAWASGARYLLVEVVGRGLEAHLAVRVEAALFEQAHGDLAAVADLADRVQVTSSEKPAASIVSRRCPIPGPRCTASARGAAAAKSGTASTRMRQRVAEAQEAAQRDARQRRGPRGRSRPARAGSEAGQHAPGRAPGRPAR